MPATVRRLRPRPAVETIAVLLQQKVDAYGGDWGAQAQVARDLIELMEPPVAEEDYDQAMHNLGAAIPRWLRGQVPKEPRYLNALQRYFRLSDEQMDLLLVRSQRERYKNLGL